MTLSREKVLLNSICVLRFLPICRAFATDIIKKFQKNQVFMNSDALSDVKSVSNLSSLRIAFYQKQD